MKKADRLFFEEMKRIASDPYADIEGICEHVGHFWSRGVPGGNHCHRCMVPKPKRKPRKAPRS